MPSLRSLPRAIRAAALTLFAAVALTAGLSKPAHAATVQLTGATVVYTAAPGQVNKLNVDDDATGVLITRDGVGGDSDPVSIAAGPTTSTCSYVTPGISVHCSGDVDFQLGDGNDTFNASSYVGSGLLSADGGDGTDTLTGSAGNDTLTGGAGNDTITGGLGADTLNGGDGNDNLNVTGLSAVSDGNGDTLNGGDGTDAAWFNRSADVTITLDGVADDGQAGENDNVGADVENLLTGTGNDTITGSSADNRIEPGMGTDTVNGADGNDTFRANTGYDNADIFNGGNGVDTADYAQRDSTANMIISLDDTANDGYSGELDNIRTDVENVTTGDGQDTITGSSADNTLTSGDGADTFTGGAGNDTINGGAGSDTFRAGTVADGADTFNGSTGIDTADYSLRSGSLAIAISLDDTADDGLAAENDNIKADVENVTTAAGHDTITGSTASNTLTGGIGNDTINGGAGSDTINGGYGNDTLAGGTGNDTLTGDLGNDTITGDAGVDSADGGPNDDDIRMGDSTAEATIACGSGNDTLIRDATDANPSDCETKTLNLPGGPATTLTGLPSSINHLDGFAVTLTAAEPGSLECKLDAGAYAPCSDPYAVPSGLADGSHTLLVRATDISGELGTPGTFTWTKDTVAPTTTIDDLGMVYVPDPEVGLGSDETGVSYECALDGAAFAACQNPHTLSGLTDGTYTLRVRAIDAASNVDATPASHTFPVDLPDRDFDGVDDAQDTFPDDASETVDNDGDGTGDHADTDDDNDGALDAADAFPLDPAESLDSDRDGTGDHADADDDNDGVSDAADAFPHDAAEQADGDGDGVGDHADAFPHDAAEQADGDGDGVGDHADAFPHDATEQRDGDGDGTGDNADPDDDNDGVKDSDEGAPANPPADPQPPVTPAIPFDTDGDGISNDWLINGKPAAGPARPKLTQVTSTSIRVRLPKGKTGQRASVYIRATGGTFAKLGIKAGKGRVLTIKGLKRNTSYQIKLVKVNAAGKQSAAARTLTVTTRK